jgi:hypothetical protein
MSHRTILEFNHDYLHDMEKDPKFWDNLLLKLKSNDWKERFTRDTPGVRKVGERHHSSKLVIEVGGYRTDVS